MLGLLLKVAGTVAVTNLVTGVALKKALESDTIGPAIADAYMKRRKLIEEQAAKYKPKVKGLNLFGKETAAQADKIISDLTEKIKAARQQNGGTPPGAA